MVLDWQTGRLLASGGVPRRGAPGSAIKPLLLAYALEHHIVDAATEVYCRRDLHIGRRSLPCTHPVDHPVFAAETALAESCNTWFAALGRRFTGPELEAALSAVHLTHAPMADASAEQRELAVLGLEGTTVSPAELARSYRNLLVAEPDEGTVVRGLRDSVGYGMANPASVPGLDILGKTGTASGAGETWTHGWFAGALAGRLIVVVYVPHGDGGTAAHLARKFFENVAAEGRSR